LRSRSALAAIAFCLLAWNANPASAQIDHPAFPPILAAAESLLQSMKARDYPATWHVLTAKSRETIVSETDDAIRKTGDPSVPKDRIRDDFAAGGPLCRQYWEGFLRRFNPDDALEKSRWEMGWVGKDRAEVLITRQGADRPAVLKMFLEADGWKAGLVETFWSR
jgi:hypothetical protein